MKEAFLIIAVFLAGCAGTPKDRFVIEGRVPSLADSTMLTLYRIQGRMMIPVDTAYIQNGRFSFDYPTTEKEEIALTSDSEGMSTMFLTIWTEPGKKATIRGENALLYTWTVKSRIPKQQESELYKQNSKEEWEEYQRIGIQENKLRTEYMQAGTNEEKQEISRQRGILRSSQDSIRYIIYDKMLSFMASSQLSPMLVEELNGISLMIFHYPAYAKLKEAAIAQYNRLPEEIRDSEEGIQIRRYLFPPEIVNAGDPMADATLPDLDGNMHNLSDYKGKYILLDFWSAGCGPCIMAFPEMKEAAGEFADRLTIVGISSDLPDTWKQASERYGISWVNLNAPGDQSEIAARYKVTGIPHQVIISPDGTVLDAWMGYGEGHLKKQLGKYLN